MLFSSLDVNWLCLGQHSKIRVKNNVLLFAWSWCYIKCWSRRCEILPLLSRDESVTVGLDALEARPCSSFFLFCTPLSNCWLSRSIASIPYPLLLQPGLPLLCWLADYTRLLCRVDSLCLTVSAERSVCCSSLSRSDEELFLFFSKAASLVKTALTCDVWNTWGAHNVCGNDRQYYKRYIHVVTDVR